MDEEIKTGDFVVPGDFLAVAEEFVPGEGAYEENGNIYSTCTGVVMLDVRTKKAAVHSNTTSVPVLKVGDIVIGRIDMTREQRANITIGVLRGMEDRQLPLPDLGSIHVSDIRKEYVRDLSEQFVPGGIIRARVIKAGQKPISLSTDTDDLGVIVANCSICRVPLDKEDSGLKCPSCGRIEPRKIASDYRKGIL